MKIIKISALWCPACLITNKAIDKIKEEQNIEVENLDYDFDEDEVKNIMWEQHFQYLFLWIKIKNYSD